MSTNGNNSWMKGQTGVFNKIQQWERMEREKKTPQA